jgi:thiol-disulfide isomerase/thioredoxin
MTGKRRARILLGGGVLLLAASIAFAATRVRFLQGSSDPRAMAGKRAPEFTGIDRWLNSPPLTLSSLRGKVVWIDFWTYSCINCIRTLPHLREVYARYRPYGLEVVGVHSPEFSFEKDARNVAAAVERYRLAYPVAMDNDMKTWRAYRNAYWPRVYLLDATGRIRFDHAGEGGEQDLQTVVRQLLTEAGARTLPAPIDFAATGPNASITPEIYAGYERGGAQGALANVEGYSPDADVTYKPVSDAEVERAGTGGAFFCEGTWRNAPEYMESRTDGARIRLAYSAQKVFMVAAPSGAPVRAVAGARALDVARSDLYELVSLARPESHILTLTVPKGFRLYTFTFG